MKIYILPTKTLLQSPGQPFKYPAHNKDYGVEQDFYKYITEQNGLTTNDPKEADWHYLPVFWTRWHLNHDYGKNGVELLQEEVNKMIIDDKKTFTICQYDDGPLVDIGETTQFLAARKGKEGIDIPVLCSPHRYPFFTPRKKYLASFVGRLSTNNIRKLMAKELSKTKDVFIVDGNKGSSFFVKNTLRSYIALCPRGYGGSSFRLFESMQLRVVPLVIGDLDIRPFKKFIDWDTVSLYTNNVKNIEKIMFSNPLKKLVEMGDKAKDLYEKELAYGKWCKYVLLELEQCKK